MLISAQAGDFFMIKDNYLDIDKIVDDTRILKLFRAVEAQGGVLRFVGGCVRDALKGVKGFDIDLATDLSPDELVEACSDYGLKTIPIGIKFGTIGVIIGDKVLEVTSLRKDVSTDGRHAVVEFTDNWEVDASRRDLTINAVYADEKGNVFDYYNGISDLEQGIVRFIGNASQRIKEDYLRILRFFRFYSLYGTHAIDKKALKACHDNRDGLKTLSMERIRDEFSKIMATPNVVNTLQIMIDNHILEYIMPQPKNLDMLEFLVNMVEKEGLETSLSRRLYILYLPDEDLAENLTTRLRLTRKQKQSFIRWVQVPVTLQDFEDNNRVLKLIYRYGKDFCIDKLLLTCAINKKEINNLHDRIEFINSAIVPIFPIRGKDIIGQGHINSPKIGQIMKELEQIWENSDFKLSRDELLDISSKMNVDVAG